MNEDWIEPTAENLSARGIQRRPRAAAAERMTRMRQGETAEAQAGGFALFDFGEDS